MMKTNEDRNVIGILQGRSEFLESDSNVSEGSGGTWSSGVWLAQCWSLGGWLEWSWRSGRGSILDWMEILAIGWGSQELDTEGQYNLPNSNDGCMQLRAPTACPECNKGTDKDITILKWLSIHAGLTSECVSEVIELFARW